MKQNKKRLKKTQWQLSKPEHRVHKQPKPDKEQLKNKNQNQELSQSKSKQAMQNEAQQDPDLPRKLKTTPTQQFSFFKLFFGKRDGKTKDGTRGQIS